MPPINVENTVELIAPHVTDHRSHHPAQERRPAASAPALQSLPFRIPSALGANVWYLIALFIMGACAWLTLPARQPQSSQSPAAAVSPAATFKPVVRRIADYRLGFAVLSDSAHGDNDTEFGDHVDAPTWRHLILKASKTDGSYADVELLRPLWWLKEQDAQIGGTIDINVPECGIEGDAKVLDIRPCPDLHPTPPGYRTVTGTFHHQAAQILELHVEGLDEPIRTTPNHPFWSHEAKAFLRADQLQVGEQLAAFDRFPKVQNIYSTPIAESVFNLEVQVTHLYRVSADGILVHNALDSHGYSLYALGEIRKMLSIGSVKGEYKYIAFGKYGYGRGDFFHEGSKTLIEASKYDLSGAKYADKMYQHKMAQLEKYADALTKHDKNTKD